MKEFSKDFKLVLIGQIISLFGASILRFALSLYILDTTGSATIFGTLSGISVIPTIFLSPIGGVIADRYNKRNLMVIFDLISSVVVALFAVMLFSGNVTIIMIGFLMSFLSVISCMYQPTVQSSIPVLVTEKTLMKGNGMITGVISIANFLGPILGGVLYSISSINVIVIASAVSFFLSAILELFIHIPYEKKQQAQNAVKMIVSDMKDGIRYIIHDNRFVLKTITIVFIINLLVAPVFFVGLPYIIKVMLKMPDTYFGFTQAGMSLSIIFSAMTIGLLKDKVNKSTVYLWIIACASVFGLMAFGTSGIISSRLVQYLISSLSAVLVMFTLTVISIFITTTIQKDTPKALLGKVMAIQSAIVTCASPIGQTVMGYLVDTFADKISVLLLGVGVLTVVTAFIAKKVYGSSKATSKAA